MTERTKAWVMERTSGERFVGLSLPSGDYSLELHQAAQVALVLTEAIERAQDPTELPPAEAPRSREREDIQRGLEELGLA